MDGEDQGGDRDWVSRLAERVRPFGVIAPRRKLQKTSECAGVAFFSVCSQQPQRIKKSVSDFIQAYTLLILFIAFLLLEVTCAERKMGFFPNILKSPFFNETPELGIPS